MATYVVVGAVAGVVWEWLWTPPTQVVQQHQLFYTDFGSLRRVFTGTGLYALVAAVASALVALVAGLLTRRHELLVLAAVTLGSLAAAYTMHTVGVALGPADPTALAKTAADGTHVSAQLVVNGKSPYLVWPMVSLFVLALVFFAWPGALRRPSPRATATEPVRSRRVRGEPGIGSRAHAPHRRPHITGSIDLVRAAAAGRHARVPRLRDRSAADSGLVVRRLAATPRCPRAARAAVPPGGSAAVVVGVLALGAGAMAAASFFAQGAQPAEALPSTTVAYASVDLDPSGSQKIDAFRTLNKFPAFKDKVGIHSVDDVRAEARRRADQGPRLPRPHVQATTSTPGSATGPRWLPSTSGTRTPTRSR